MSKFLRSGSTFDGVASELKPKIPSTTSLISIATIVNDQKLQLLVDTGSTKTFISRKALSKMKSYNVTKNQSCAFVLADGLAPFYVLGTMELSILFADQATKVQAYVAHNLCTDVILDMDYITHYNLKFDTKQQWISTELNNREYYMNVNSDYSPQLIPITLSKPLRLSPKTNCSTKVSIPISSICSPFISNTHFTQNNVVYIPKKLLQFYNYSTTLTLSNMSSYPQYYTKGIRIGFLYSCHIQQLRRQTLAPMNTLNDATKSFGSPTLCSTISPIQPMVDKNLHELVRKIECQQHRRNLLSLLLHFDEIFNVASTPIHHVINTKPQTPPARKSYPQPDKEEEMYTIIQEFLQAGLITKSHSPYAAPAMLVKKNDGTSRLVIDYKKLNLITIKDSSPLPNMEDTIRKLGHGYKYFSKLDLKSGFYQIPINAADKEKTAFVTRFGLYQFNVLPIGLINSPPTFQKVMTDTLKSCRQFCLVCLDDIIVFSKSYEEHMLHLEQVFSALQTRHFVLNPPKCELMVPTINYLGHTISENAITPMNEKILAILNMKEPNTLARANKFIGALSWYRKFIPNFATVAAPIHSVTNLNKKDRRKFKWTASQSVAFHKLKQMLTTHPLFLHFPIDTQPLILTTDANDFGIRSVLQQEVNGVIRNLYYHSQLMTASERRYSSIEKEALAIYKCFARMRPYLLGRNIVIKTDHCPLCNIMTKTIRNKRVD